MQSNKSHVPWSRHLSVSPDTTHGKNPRVDVFIKKRGIQGRTISKISLNNRRRVQSESSIGSGNHEEENWDSQSDPGSASPSDRKGFSSKHTVIYTVNVNNDDVSGNIIDPAVKQIKPTVQGRGGHQQNGIPIRRRKRDGSDRVHKNQEVAVEIRDQNGNSANHPHYIQSYLDFMRYVCLNPHKFNIKDLDDKYDQTTCLYALCILQKVSKFMTFK